MRVWGTPGWLLLAALCCPRPCVAQPAHLVKDINPIDDPAAGSGPTGLTAAGDAVFFIAADHGGVLGLWRSDGTQDGARLLFETGTTTELAAVNGSVFFGSGCELWKTDGTTVGTVLIKDFRTLLDQACFPLSELTNVDGRLFFAVDDRQGRSLWTSNGTARGTRFVRRANARNLLAVGKRLFFTQRMEATGNELWTSDGTRLGTRLVKDICPGICDGVFGGDAAALDGVLYFPANDGVHGYRLWRSDGTRPGTRLVDEANPGGPPTFPQHLVATGNKVFFGAYDGSNHDAFWASDGTASGTLPLKQVRVLTASAVMDRVFFVAWDWATGAEPWVSDGSDTGTVALGDLCSGNCSSVDYQTVFTVVGNRAFFAASASGASRDLWASDGTPNGTALVKNVSVGPEAGAVARGLFFFRADDGINGDELWKSDGTDGGTVSVTNRVSNSSCTYGSTPVNGRLFFSVCLPRDVAGLWVSDGTDGGTSLVKNFFSGPYMLTDYQGVALFWASDGFSLGLWRSDGTEAGTARVSDIEPLGPPPNRFVIAGGEAFFTRRDLVAGVELWKTDGTPGGTTMVKDIAPGIASSSPQYLTVANDVLFFSALSWDAATGDSNPGLWRSDGTEGGTTLVKNVVSWDLTDVNGTLFFVGYELTESRIPKSGWQIWRSDGTTAGTVPLKELLFPQWLVNMDGTLFFVAGDRAGGVELWKSNGTAAGTVRVKDIVLGSRDSNPSLLTVANGTLYFMACTEAQGCELWRSDGTATGTVMVKDINPGLSDSALNRGLLEIVAVQDKVFFQADDGVSGIELWESDGTEAGTRLVEDLAPGPQFSLPHNIARVGSTLFFAADDGVVGDELWALDLGPRITVWPGTAVEHACQKTLAKVTVTLSGPSSRPVTVQYATSDGTAKAGQDYLAVSGTLGFAPGVTSRVIKVPIAGDRVVEPDEYFNVVLNSPTGGILDETASTAAVWIEDQPQLAICR